MTALIAHMTAPVAHMATPRSSHDCPHSSHDCLRSSEALLPHLASLDLADRAGKTALHHAAYNGHQEMVSLLLVKGASVKALDRGEKTALHLAAYMGEYCMCIHGGHSMYNLCFSPSSLPPPLSPLLFLLFRAQGMYQCFGGKRSRCQCKGQEGKLHLWSCGLEVYYLWVFGLCMGTVSVLCVEMCTCVFSPASYSTTHLFTVRPQGVKLML